MRRYSARTLFDELPVVPARDLRPGDLLMHRGLPGTDAGGARPVLRIEGADPKGQRVLIVQPIEPRRIGPKGIILHPDGESKISAGADQLVTLAPPTWPHGITQQITERDVRDARAYVGDRAAN